MSVMPLSPYQGSQVFSAIAAQSMIRLMQPSDLAAIDDLLDRCFGPQRLQKTAQLLRDGNCSIAPLDHVVTDAGGQVIGSIRYWPVDVDGPQGPETVLWLGPLAVDPDHEGKGLGGLLMRHSMAIAAQMGFSSVLLVGDAPWYKRFGFSAHHTAQLDLPGSFDPTRLLAAPLQNQAALHLQGMIRLPWSLTSALAAE